MESQAANITETPTLQHVCLWLCASSVSQSSLTMLLTRPQITLNRTWMACPWGHFQNRLKYWETQHLTTWSKSHTLYCLTDKVLLNLFTQDLLKACAFQENNKANSHCEPKILVTKFTSQERSSSCARSPPWNKIQLTHTGQRGAT